jgi:hypothetical protein
MSRWSNEEDKHIQDIIQELEDEINYKELVLNHNSKFNTKRTEESYKVRVRKIVKENNISFKSNNHWTDEEKIYIINAIKNNPINTNFTEISEHLKRSELSIKKVYNELVTMEEHLDSCLLNIKNEDINKILHENKHICSNCNKKMYIMPQIWKDREYCEECYYTLYNDIVNECWQKVSEYSVKKNKNYCNICNKNATFDNSIKSRFHYDHVDMFDKSDSICKMVKEGMEITNIYEEIDKCQLLCISCHSIITKMENICGFIRIKKQINKEYNESNDDEKKNELIKKYSNLYNNFMNKVYKLMRDTI